jgi:DNA-binding transcriptional ArsR family regulator
LTTAPARHRFFLNQQVEKEVVVDRLSQVFAALADATRRDLVARLAQGDASVGELAAPYDVSVQAVSKHLKVLEHAGLISRVGDGRRSPVRLEAEALGQLTEWLDRYRREAEERYRRLDAVLAAMADAEPRDASPTDLPSKQSRE